DVVNARFTILPLAAKKPGSSGSAISLAVSDEMRAAEMLYGGDQLLDPGAVCGTDAVTVSLNGSRGQDENERRGDDGCFSHVIISSPASWPPAPAGAPAPCGSDRW